MTSEVRRRVTEARSMFLFPKALEEIEPEDKTRKEVLSARLCRIVEHSQLKIPV